MVDGEQTDSAQGRNEGIKEAKPKEHRRILLVVVKDRVFAAKRESNKIRE